MNIELTTKQFRRLLDMVYIGNWVLNSARGEDRIPDFDEVESRIFSYCEKMGMEALSSRVSGVSVPSKDFSEGGIHEAIMDYEDAVFFGILAEELTHRDLSAFGDVNDSEEFEAKAKEYLAEFRENGLGNVNVDL